MPDMQRPLAYDAGRIFQHGVVNVSFANVGSSADGWRIKSSRNLGQRLRRFFGHDKEAFLITKV